MRQRVKFIAKAKAAGRAKIFTTHPFLEILESFSIMMINKMTPKVNWSVIPHSEGRNKPERGIGFYGFRKYSCRA
jgi:hypothetical protein